ncbi:TonB-dependent receptor [Ascidiimonas sp. W6]|uniref:TonB-dependent receptor n=1 Tax=Ascidiimonas meishanensis TaxID=3128903 RepID=UPI0030ECC52D
MSKAIKFLFIFILTSASIHAQDEKDKKRDIGTEVVNVVKPYTPSVSDAFKVKQVPTLNDSVTTTKKEIKYTIFSVPVASTFVPAKAKASVVKKAKKEVLFNTYASLGLGNFSTALVDFYTSRALARDETLDLSLNHHSSQGGIDGVVLDDNFFNTRLEGNYRKKTRYLEWGADAGFKHQIFNWYGIPEQPGFTNSQLTSLDAKQTYYTTFLGANLSLKDSYYKEGSLLLQRFWDGSESGETRAKLTPVFEIPISGELITTKVTIDYLGGNFERNYANDAAISYSNLLLGITPNLVVLRDDLTVNLGASIFYAKEEDDGTLFIYPNVTASYRLVDEYVIAFGGIEGKPIQNSYQSFVANNPFVSPTLLVKPTDQQYDAYLGVKGKLMSNVGYNVKASYVAANNQPLFKANYVNAFDDGETAFAYGNSFDVVYDNVKTISVFGELKVDINRDFTFRLQGEIFEYTTDVEAEAWNLPTVRGSLSADYQISEKWAAGLNIFYTGERNDVFTADPEDTGAPLAPQLVTLESFFDVNARLSYQFDSQLSAFLRLNNLSGNEYARWATYPVQGFQVLAGATYKFDL